MSGSIILIDQVDGVIKKWADDYGFTCPSLHFIDSIKSQTIENIRHYFNCSVKIVNPTDVKNLIEIIPAKSTVVSLSSLFNPYITPCESKGIVYIDLPISRIRFPLHTGHGFWPGHGRLGAINRTLDEIAVHVRRKFNPSHHLICLDDSVTYGNTLRELIAKFNSCGLKVERCIVGVSVMKGTAISGTPLCAGLQSDSSQTIIELKDFLDLPGAGAAFPKGFYTQRKIVKELLNLFVLKDMKSLMTYCVLKNIKIKDIDLLKSQYLNVDRKSISNERIFRLMESFVIPQANAAMASEGRISFLWPGHQGSAWKISKQQWIDLSLLQHILSKSLYVSVEDLSKRTVMARELPQCNERNHHIDKKFVDYLDAIIAGNRKISRVNV